MTRAEHLLVILAEECAEVAQRASKALRFGLLEVQPEQPLTNSRRLTDEMTDLWATWRMLQEIGAVGSSLGDTIAKREKVEKYLRYSAECGTLDGEDFQLSSVAPAPPFVEAEGGEP